jgi:hypothetical protein
MDFLEPRDACFRACLKYLDRLNKLLSKQKQYAELAQLNQKTYNTLSQKKAHTKNIDGNCSAEILKEIEKIKKKEEEEEDEDLWTAESLCFRYFNFFQQFKTEMATEIEWLQHCSRGASMDD